MRILIVDDVAAVRQFLQLALGEFRRAEIDEAGDGAQAIQLLKQHKYDLVLLDLHLPVFDGFKVLSLLRQGEGDGPRTPVIVVSTLQEDSAVERVRALGVEHVLPKPLRAHLLQQAIRSVLGLDDTTAPGGEPAERRKMPRASLSLVVEIGGEVTFRGTTSDASPFGVFVLTEQVPPVGTHVTVSLEFPHLPEPLRASGEVVHVRTELLGGLPSGFAVRFDGGDNELYARLHRAFESPP